MPKSELKCEPWQPSDLNAAAKLIWTLADAAYMTGAPWSEQTILADLKLATSYYWLMTMDTEPIGFLSATQVLDQVELTNIGVLKNHQQRGLGRQLLENWLESLPVAQTVTLEVRQQNVGAMKLYKNLDFQQIAVRKAYYADPVDDAVVMQRRT